MKFISSVIFLSALFGLKAASRGRELTAVNADPQSAYIYYPSWNQFSVNEIMKSVTTEQPSTEAQFRPFENELRSRLLPAPSPIVENDELPAELQFERGDVNPKDCGKTADLLTHGRVVGGRIAIPEEFPWQVALLTKQNKKSRGQYQHVCGASIINNRWIVTAAHCTYGVELSKIKGIIGTNDVKTFGENAMQVYFDKVVIHDGYSHGLYNNDISLLHTTKEMPLFTKTTAINAVCLPINITREEGYATITGWGRINEEGPRTSRLQALDVPLQEAAPCEQAYENIFNKENMICAGFVQGGRDSCQADSGGPLVIQENDKSYLLGIVSFGSGCARRRNPGVYTKVSRYIEWIKDNMHI